MSSRTLGSLLTAAIVASALLLPGAIAAEERWSYGYFRTVEGNAWISPSDETGSERLETNRPLLAGDGVEVNTGGRIEAVLPDGSVVRLDGGARVFFERLALSGDTGDEVTLLRLQEGELQLRVGDEALGRETPRVDTLNATVYIQEAGSYRVFADGRAWTEVTVRKGYAEVVTQRGSAVVRQGEAVSVEGADWPQVGVRAASYPSSLERWGESLEREAQYARSSRLEPGLAYAGAPLERHGRWISVSGRWAWRPSVHVEWRPYSTGWWLPTPSGLTWVSNEPWGWVTYHYGSWNYSAPWGWVWYPGTVYSPAWVYWYWGPRYAGWVPTGYYVHHYRNHYARIGFGFRFGTYGWAGGSWGHFRHWNFCDVGRIGRRGHHGTYRSGHRLALETRSPSLARGLVTTDTRVLDRRTLERPEQVMDLLATRTRLTRGSSELPDVTPFVSRQDALPAGVVDSLRARVPGESLERPLTVDAAGTRGVSARGPQIVERIRTGEGAAADRTPRADRSELPPASWRNPRSTPSDPSNGVQRSISRRMPEVMEAPRATAEAWRGPSVRGEARNLGRREEDGTRGPVAGVRAPTGISDRGRAPSASPTGTDAWRTRSPVGTGRGTELSPITPRSGVARSPASTAGPTASDRPRSSIYGGHTSTTSPPAVRRVWDGIRSYGDRTRSVTPRGSTAPGNAPRTSAPVVRRPPGSTMSSPGATLPRRVSPPQSTAAPRSVAPPARSSSGVQRPSAVRSSPNRMSRPVAPRASSPSVRGTPSNRPSAVRGRGGAGPSQPQRRE